MRRKIICCCVLLNLLMIGLTGCGFLQKPEENIEAIYQEAFADYCEAAKLIYVPSIEKGEAITDENGDCYIEVLDSEHQDTESIQKALEFAFSTAYIESALQWVLHGETPYYKEIDGQLYVLMADAIGEGIGADIIDIIEQTENKIILKVEGDLSPSEVTLVYENERWVFDQFKDL